MARLTALTFEADARGAAVAIELCAVADTDKGVVGGIMEGVMPKADVKKAASRTILQLGHSLGSSADAGAVRRHRISWLADSRAVHGTSPHEPCDVRHGI